MGIDGYGEEFEAWAEDSGLWREDCWVIGWASERVAREAGEAVIIWELEGAFTV